jgi:hypothetical protein
MRIFNINVEKKIEHLNKLILKYGIDDPMVVKESQLLNQYLVEVQAYNDKFLR